MKNLIKNKKRLFDGAESDFYVFSSILDTPDFGQVLFDNRQVQYLWEGIGGQTTINLSVNRGLSPIVSLP